MADTRTMPETAKLDVLSVEVTTRCTLRCADCFAHADGEAWADMPFETAAAVVAEGARLGFGRLSLTGGEPLLWPRLEELAGLALEAGYGFVLVNTNAERLDEARCRSLAALGPKVEFSVTLNGAPGLHDAVRGAGAHARASAGLARGLAAGLGISVFSVVDKRGLPGLPAWCAELRREFPGSLAHFLIQLRAVEDGYFRSTGQKLEPSDFVELVRMAGLLALGGMPVQFLENSLATVVARRLGYGWLPASEEISRPGKLVVMRDGGLAPNHSSRKRFGQWRPGALEATLASAAYRAATEPDEAACAGCGFVACCREAGKLRPSGPYHNTGDPSVPLCRKVLEALS